MGEVADLAAFDVLDVPGKLVADVAFEPMRGNVVRDHDGYNTAPGFRIPSGSSASLIRRVNAMTSDPT